MIHIKHDRRDGSTNGSYKFVTYGPPGTKGLNCYGDKMVVIPQNLCRMQILEAVIEGDVNKAEGLAGEHITQALIALEERLKSQFEINCAQQEMIDEYFRL